MKRIIVLCLVLALLCACQPTPTEDAVKQKDTNVLIDTVKAGQESGETGEAAASAKDMTPERFQYDGVTDVQNVQIHADVPIEILSETGVFPMLRVSRRTLTDEERLTVSKRLFHSDQLYVYEYHPTREALERMIQELMEEPTREEKAEWMSDLDATEEEWQEMLENRRATAAEYQKQYNALPEDDAPVPLAVWDGSAPVYSDDWEHNSNQITVVGSETVSGFFDHALVFADKMNDHALEFETAATDVTDITTAWFFNNPNKFGTARIDPKDYDKPHEGASISPNDAIKLAQSYFDGIGTFAASDVYWANNAATDGDIKGIQDNTRWVYLIHLSEVRGGAYQVYCQGSAWDEPTESQYVRTWDYETLMAAVDGSGKLVSIVWLAPLKTEDVISESTPLLPFEKIETIFETQMNRQFSEDEYKDGVLTVDNVQLGQFRIREKNNLDSGFLVPVWFFTGSFVYNEQEQQRRKAIDAYEWYEAHFNSLNPLLIVNAIDGTVIDPYKGY